LVPMLAHVHTTIVVFQEMPSELGPRPHFPPVVPNSTVCGPGPDKSFAVPILVE